MLLLVVAMAACLQPRHIAIKVHCRCTTCQHFGCVDTYVRPCQDGSVHVPGAQWKQCRRTTLLRVCGRYNSVVVVWRARACVCVCVCVCVCTRADTLRMEVASINIFKVQQFGFTACVRNFEYNDRRKKDNTHKVQTEYTRASYVC